MNTSKLKVTAVAVVLLALVAVIVREQSRAKRLMAEGDTLRKQVQEEAALRDESQRLAEQLRAASERAQADLKELPRLRGELARVRQIEQESTRLRAERDRLAKTVASSTPEDSATPEVKLRRAKGFFGRDLGMALILAANANDGKVPAELRGPVFEMVESLSAGAEFGLRASQFELVYTGSLRDVQGGETVLAREKEPVQLPDGKWMKVYVMANGASLQISAAARDAFAARERELWPGQFKP
jgi:hypothetical protein